MPIDASIRRRACPAVFGQQMGRRVAPDRCTAGVHGVRLSLGDRKVEHADTPIQDTEMPTVVPVYFGSPAATQPADDLREHGVVAVDTMRTAARQLAAEVERELGLPSVFGLFFGYW